MKKLFTVLTAMIVVISMASLIQAEEQKTQTVIGQVMSMTDEDGNIVSSTLTDAESADMYDIILNDKGMELANVSSEITVKVTGIVTVDEELGTKSITVKEFEEVVPEETE